ncbi:MAG: flagellar export chaperone FliS [Acidobacteriota bacterium]
MSTPLQDQPFPGARSRGAAAYRAIDVDHANPIRLTAAATRGAAVEAGRALAALRAADDSACGEAISRASNLIGVLREGLDLARGEELARNLDQVYVYLQMRLLRANISRDSGLLEEVRNHLTGLAEVWESI